jgi:hypothetical protein
VFAGNENTISGSLSTLRLICHLLISTSPRLPVFSIITNFPSGDTSLIPTGPKRRKYFVGNYDT